MFHDIDYLPNNLHNSYACEKSPISPGRCIIKRNGELWFKWHYSWGGVFAANKSSFEAVNGMSNLYFGWGWEDTDLGTRFRHVFKKIPNPDCRYKHIRTSTMVSSRPAACLICTAVQRMYVDGLNSLKYHLMEVVEESLYTVVRVEIKQKDYRYPPCTEADRVCSWTKKNWKSRYFIKIHDD